MVIVLWFVVLFYIMWFSLFEEGVIFDVCIVDIDIVCEIILFVVIEVGLFEVIICIIVFGVLLCIWGDMVVMII